MLGQRRRRWSNIKTALDQCLVWVVSCNQFSGYINAVNLYSIGYCWPTLDRPRHARFEAEWFFNVITTPKCVYYIQRRHNITDKHACIELSFQKWRSPCGYDVLMEHSQQTQRGWMSVGLTLVHRICMEDYFLHVIAVVYWYQTYPPLWMNEIGWIYHIIIDHFQWNPLYEWLQCYYSSIVFRIIKLINLGGDLQSLTDCPVLYCIWIIVVVDCGM